MARFAFLFIAALLAAQLPAAERLPNVVLILADDKCWEATALSPPRIEIPRKSRL
jgi:hypothetical protein